LPLCKLNRFGVMWWALLEIAILLLVVGWIVWMIKPPKK